MSLLDVITSEGLIDRASQHQQFREAGLLLSTTATDDVADVYARLQLEAENEQLLAVAPVLRRHRACKKAGLL